MKNKILILLCFLLIGSSLVIASYADNNNDETEEGQVSYGDFLVQLGIITGDPSGDLREEDQISREEFMVILMKISHIVDVEVSEVPSFSDVPKNRWSYKYIEGAKNAGLTIGTGNNKFSPSAKLTYQQVSKFLVNCLGYDVDYTYASQIAKEEYNVYSNEGMTSPHLKRKHVFEMVSRTLFSGLSNGIKAWVVNMGSADRANILTDLLNYIIEEDLRYAGTTLAQDDKIFDYEFKTFEHGEGFKEISIFEERYVNMFKTLVKSDVVLTEISKEELFNSINPISYVSDIYRRSGFHNTKINFHTSFIDENSDEKNDPKYNYSYSTMSIHFTLNRFYDNYMGQVVDTTWHHSLHTLKSIYAGNPVKYSDDNEVKLFTPYVLNYIKYNWRGVFGDHRIVQVIAYLDEEHKVIFWSLVSGDKFATARSDVENKKVEYQYGPLPLDQYGFVNRNEVPPLVAIGPRIGFSEAFMEKSLPIEYNLLKRDISDDKDVNYGKSEFSIAFARDYYGFSTWNNIITDESKKLLIDATYDLELNADDQAKLSDFMNDKIDYRSFIQNSSFIDLYNGVPEEHRIYNFYIERIQ